MNDKLTIKYLFTHTTLLKKENIANLSFLYKYSTKSNGTVQLRVRVPWAAIICGCLLMWRSKTSFRKEMYLEALL